MFRTQSGGTLILSGLHVQEQRQVALQVSALGQAPEARNGVTLQGARLLVVSLRSRLSPRLGEVFGIIARTLWHGDCVVVHCMAGRRRAALLVCVTLALLETPNFGTGPIEPSVEPGCPPGILRRSGSLRLKARICTCSCRMGPPSAAMARLVHQIVFATPTPPVTGMRRLHGSDLSAMNAFVGPLLAFGL